MYEVELKFPLAASAPVLQQLAAWGAAPDEPLRQCDQYFNHPVRDFKQTDEAFRIRSAGDVNCVTYKGPVLDRQTKMRHEIEIGIDAGAAAAASFAGMLVQLGFRPSGVVKKTRVTYHLAIDGRKYELALDDVDGLGMFLEIETLAEESEKESARDGVLELARKLGLPADAPERRSYLALVLALSDG